MVEALAPAPLQPLPLRRLAAAVPVDLALVLAVDTSGSVGEARLRLQTEGYARALRRPELVAAVRGGRRGRIALSLIQWSGAERQTQAVGWRLIEDAAGARAFAAAIDEAPGTIPDWTSISGAIDFARGLLAACPYPARRRVLDISGDGPNNDGRPVEAARDEVLAAGITINGLALLDLEPSLGEYFEASVIGGPGAFAMAVGDLAGFGEALLRKLVTEIGGIPPEGEGRGYGRA
jgi:hypothetical protein